MDDDEDDSNDSITIKNVTKQPLEPEKPGENILEEFEKIYNSELPQDPGVLHELPLDTTPVASFSSKNPRNNMHKQSKVDNKQKKPESKLPKSIHKDNEHSACKDCSIY